VVGSGLATLLAPIDRDPLWGMDAIERDRRVRACVSELERQGFVRVLDPEELLLEPCTTLGKMLATMRRASFAVVLEGLSREGRSSEQCYVAGGEVLWCERFPSGTRRLWCPDAGDARARLRWRLGGGASQVRGLRETIQPGPLGEVLTAWLSQVDTVVRCVARTADGRRADFTIGGGGVLRRDRPTGELELRSITPEELDELVDVLWAASGTSAGAPR
jgi:hypothetical protein